MAVITLGLRMVALVNSGNFGEKKDKTKQNKNGG